MNPAAGATQQLTEADHRRIAEVVAEALKKQQRA
jgi:hypothetical protein